ncbi:DUF5780 domain-containing protein [Sporosarcina sp. FA9]|uniref:DUF5780 domain-containing protein n=1 Tax=Sporosarcina sp. FA9 TaxID=3413030 RepID=UPI003F655073
MKKWYIYSLLGILMIFLAGCSNGSMKDAETEKVNESEDAKELETVSKEVLVDDKEEVEEKGLMELKREALDFSVEILDLSILIQDEELKALYPDLFSVVVKNNTEVDIRDYQVALMAWDSNDLPLKIRGQFDFSNGRYIVNVDAKDVNLIPGATDGEQSGLPLDEQMKDLHTLDAIVQSFTDFDDNVVENKAAKAFLDAIEGKTLK